MGRKRKRGKKNSTRAKKRKMSEVTKSVSKKQKVKKQRGHLTEYSTSSVYEKKTQKQDIVNDARE